MDEWSNYLELASQIIEGREHYQRKLGQLASDIVMVYGMEALKDFAVEIKETYGLLVSASTLKNYRWVHEKTAQLELPLDLSYRTLQYIASSKDPKAWAERIKKEGLTSPEIYRLLREEKGKPKKRKIKTTCPNCGAFIEIDAQTKKA